ncbi:MAG: hypothetical protein UT37_C0007G0023 [Parcubacteria group bacterium GW2011_GWA2_39_18]|nr:MAG: hypothetical protein UT37_C0007G0023 [Parcubacteria group bacterium GW2011_GWA2_39_18]
MDKTTRPIEMIPLEEAWVEIGDNVSVLDGQMAVFENNGFHVKGTLVVSGSKMSKPFVAFRPNNADELSSVMVLAPGSLKIFWPKPGQPDPTVLNFDNCFVECP